MIKGTGFLFANYHPSPGSALAESPSRHTTTYASPSRTSSNNDPSYSWQSQSQFEEGSSILNPSTFLRERDGSTSATNRSVMFDSPTPASGRGNNGLFGVGAVGSDKGKGKKLEDTMLFTPPRNPLLPRTTYAASTSTSANDASSNSSFLGNASTAATIGSITSSPSKSALSTPTKFFSTSFPSTTSGLYSSPPKRDLSNLGYFVFPPNASSANGTNNVSEEDKEEKDAKATENTAEVPMEALPVPLAAPPVISAAQLERLEREKAEARRGEEEWVRSGGVLRDKDGNRDLERTEKVKEELRVRDWEAEVLGRWEVYEKAWSELSRMVNSSSSNSNGEERVRFTDIPWPVTNRFASVYIPKSNSNNVNSTSTQNHSRARAGIHGPPKPASVITLADLTPDSIQSFILDPLKVRGNTTSTKERIRTSLLRWHPDKLTGLVSRVAEEDVDDVTEGIGIVIRCLREISGKS
ncbi:hypothetical protein K435DRAFT_966932 [Dendrothele bispora CBS 962.96]|uniref:Uncharacterized protein n=1 Tax=Dendrothele bispora (strain CBS 962.96) TaxID=1314807 RepID=A0A4S8LYB4_DENBC|nr:hypothetical protein K435DRAFT_966932 [Dendrothele bispora CBS 962.96]